MKNKLKKIMALLSAALILFSFSACGSENNNGNTTTTTAAVETDETTAAGEEQGDVEEDVDEDIEEDTEEDTESGDAAKTTKKSNEKTTKKSSKKTTKKSSEKTTKKSSKKTTKKSSEKTTKKSSTKTTKKSSEKTTKKSSTKTTKKSNEKTTKKSTPSTKKEAVAIYNKAMNLVKSNKAGYTKHNIKTAEGEVDGALNVLRKVFENDSVDTYAKGTSEAYNNFPIEGFSFGSKLSADNVTKYTIKESGDNYVIHMEVSKRETNPTKGKGIFGSFLSIMDRQEVLDKTSLIKECTLTYHDGTIDAKINKKTNRPVEIKVYAYVDVTITAFGKDWSVPDIRGGSTYYDFKW